MSRWSIVFLAALAGVVALGTPAQAQGTAPAESEKNVLCRFHGDGCAAPPKQWAWKRMEPRAGGYSVELPCDEKQVNLFGQVLAMSRANFQAAQTRACMKATSGFTATMVGLTALPENMAQADVDKMLRGAPDMFTAIRQRSAKVVPETTIKGRRAIVNTIDKPEGRSKVAIVEVGKYAIVMLSADIRKDFPGTREEGEAATARFLDSLEIVE